MVIEVFLAFLHFLLVEQAHLSPLAVGETVYYGTAEIVAGEIVDCCSCVSTKSGEQYYERDIEVACRGMICGR